MIRRQTFNVNTSGTTIKGDTGIVNGMILGLRWYPTTISDTGANFVMTLCNASGDTAGGHAIYNDEDIGASPIFKGMTIPRAHPDGFDTGADDMHPFAAGERLRLKVNPAGNTIVGTLYVYIDEAE